MGENIQFEFWKGQLLEIYTSDKAVYFSQVMESKPKLIIQIPINQKSVPMTIENGMDITITFYDHLNDMYTFDSKINRLQTGKTIIDNPAPGSIKKVQRRRFFRVEVNTEMLLEYKTNKDAEDTEALKVLTYDLSGGGVSFLHPTILFEIGDTVQGTLFLNKAKEEKKVTFIGKIVNLLPHQKDFVRTSIKFEEINEAKRSVVIEFCIAKQIELRKKIGKI